MRTCQSNRAWSGGSITCPSKVLDSGLLLYLVILYLHSQISTGPFHAVWTNGPLRCRIRAVFRPYGTRAETAPWIRAVFRPYGTRPETSPWIRAVFRPYGIRAEMTPWIHNMRMRRAGWLHVRWQYKNTQRQKQKQR